MDKKVEVHINARSERAFRKYNKATNNITPSFTAGEFVLAADLPITVTSLASSGVAQAG